MQNSNVTTHIANKKIGGTTYKVSLHFSEKSRENMSDKIFRLAQNDLIFSPESGIISVPQTGRLSERSST
jgi:hypothetical protein